MKLGKLIAKHLITKAVKSATAYVAAVGATSGAAVAYNPKLVDAIPEHYRGYVVLAYAVLILLARFRGEIAELIAELKASEQ